MRVIKLPSLASSLDQTEHDGGSLNEANGTICENENGDWVIGGVCDKKVDCKNLMDELPCMVSSLSQTEANGGSMTHENEIVCKNQMNEWIYLTDKKCSEETKCSNRMDMTACFENKMNMTQTIILNGGSSHVGVYTLQQWYNIEFYSQNGSLGLIYKPKDVEGLVIGSGNMWSATAIYREDGINLWKSVADGSLTGSLYSTKASEISLTQVPNSVDKAMLENLTHFENETVLGVGILCLDANRQEKTFIANNTAAGWCDRTWHCQHGGKDKGKSSSSILGHYSIVQGTSPRATPWPGQPSIHLSSVR